MRLLVGTAAALWLMTVARDVLLPLVVAVLVWFVLSAIAQKVVSLTPSSMRRGKTMTRVISVAGVLVVLVAIGIVVRDNVSTLIDNADIYKANLDALFERISTLAGPVNPVELSSLVKQVDVRALALNAAGSGAAYLGALFTVIIYLIFVFTEAGAFPQKVAALSTSPSKAAQIERSVGRIKASIDEFFSVSVIVGLLQAVPTYLVLWLVGVDAPVLWAVLVFLFSFIPTIGTIFGIVFPVVMTVLQFASIETTLMVLVPLAIVQVVCTNVILPQLMSSSLNLSPLVVMVAVFGGAAVWGIVGALIAVPALTVAMIVCLEKPSWRWVAVILSSNGTVPEPSEDTEAVDAAPAG